MFIVEVRFNASKKLQLIKNKINYYFTLLIIIYLNVL